MKVSKKKIWKGKEYYKIEQKKNQKEKEKRALQSVKIIVCKVHKRRQWQNGNDKTQSAIWRIRFW